MASLDVPVPQTHEHIMEVIQLVARTHSSRTVDQIVAVPVLTDDFDTAVSLRGYRDCSLHLQTDMQKLPRRSTTTACSTHSLTGASIGAFSFEIGGVMSLPLFVETGLQLASRQWDKSVVNGGLSIRYLVQLSFEIGGAKSLSLSWKQICKLRLHRWPVCCGRWLEKTLLVQLSYAWRRRAHFLRSSLR